MSACSSRHRQGGFSLLEVVAALIVLGLVLAGFTSVFGTVLRHSSEPQLREQAVSVADAYLQEILSRPYTTPPGAGCPAPGVARPLFSTPCDYHNLAVNGCTATSALCPTLGECPCDRSGEPMDGLVGFVVTVAVTPGTLAAAAGLDVTVGVSHAGLPGDAVRLRAFRTLD